MSRTTWLRITTLAACLYVSVSQSASARPYRFARLGDSGLGAPQTTGMNLGRGGRFGGRGFGGNAPDVKLLETFDSDENGRLDAREREAALAHAERLGLNRGRGGRGGDPYTADVEPGRRISPTSITRHPTTPFYDPYTLRTIFLTFENNVWERELMAFKRTDVDVPATLVVDGETYEGVGVQFHGNSSFTGVPIGLKHSMWIAIDYTHEKQDVTSYNTFLLLNAHQDPSFLRTILTMQIARDYGAAPKANLVRVVINGENWGIYVNQQQFNKDLTKEQFGSTDGARWKVPGSPGAGRAGLSYLGDDPAPYKAAYEIKSKDDPASWKALIDLTRVLNQTPTEELEKALAPILDVDGALRFLAVDNALANSDGYWTRASDYSLYMEPNGRFHLLPYDVNTTFVIGGRGGRGFGRGGSVDLHPLQAADDVTKPLAARLLAVPSLRARYRGYVRDVASTWLDWRRLGPIVERYHALIDADVKADTRKLESYEAFVESVAELHEFAERRREFLLDVTRGQE